MPRTPRAPRTLLDELHQTRPFASLDVEVVVSLLRTCDHFAGAQRTCLKPFGLTLAQFNVLRILCGAAAPGHRIVDIGERLVTREPDVTRLVDGLERKRLVRRVRCPEDRRVVRAAITPAGRRLADRASAAAFALHARQLGGMRRRDKQALLRLLTTARHAGPGAGAP